jgi:hypothetical protein
MRFGAFLRDVLGGSRAERAAVERVKAWARTTFAAETGAALAVNEIACLDPACPGSETVILVMQPGRRTWACKIPKPLDDVTKEDVRGALAVCEEPTACPVSSEPPPSA